MTATPRTPSADRWPPTGRHKRRRAPRGSRRVGVWRDDWPLARRALRAHDEPPAPPPTRRPPPPPPAHRCGAAGAAPAQPARGKLRPGDCGRRDESRGGGPRRPATARRRPAASSTLAVGGGAGEKVLPVGLKDAGADRRRRAVKPGVASRADDDGPPPLPREDNARAHRRRPVPPRASLAPPPQLAQLGRHWPNGVKPEVSFREDSLWSRPARAGGNDSPSFPAAPGRYQLAAVSGTLLGSPPAPTSRPSTA